MTTNSKIKLNLDSLKSRREWKRHKVKDGHNVFRILPPFGENSGGYPYRKWQIIWGLKNPEDGRMRPYASPMLTEKACPVTEYVKELKAKAEVMKSKLQAGGVDEEAIKERLSPLNKLISDLTPKTVYIYNAVDKSGDVGLLELKSTAHKKIKAEMLAYVQEYNQDPTSLNSADDDSGVWFNVIRTGLGRDTEYDVKKCQSKVKSQTGKITFEDDRSALPESVVENFDNLAYDLSAIYQVKSYDQLKEILDANLPDIIDAIPDANLTGKAVATPATPVAKAAAKPATKPVTLKLDDEDDASEEEETEVEAASVKAAPKAAAAPAAKPATNKASFLADMEELLNS